MWFAFFCALAAFVGGVRLGTEYGRKQRLQLGTPHQEEIPQEIAGVVLPAHDDPRWRFSMSMSDLHGHERHHHVRLGDSCLELCTIDSTVIVGDGWHVDRLCDHKQERERYVEAVRTEVLSNLTLEAIKEAT